MNLVFERVTTGSKDKGEIGSEIGNITGIVADAHFMDSQRNMYGLFDGGDSSWRMEDIC